MLTWSVEWVSFGAVLIVSVAVVIKLLGMAYSAWESGDWWEAVQRTVGPLLSFAFLVSVGGGVILWGLNTTYSNIKSSEIAGGAISWGASGVSALAGKLTSPQIDVPDPGPLTDALTEAGEKLTGAAADNPLYGEPPAPVVVPTTEPTPVVRTLGWEYLQRQQNAPANPTPHAVHTPDAVHGAYNSPTISSASSANNLYTLPTEPTPQGRGLGQEYLQRNADGGGGPLTYTVVGGDSLGKIAGRLGVSAKALCQANIVTVRNNCDLLRSGMVLVVP